MHWRGPSLNCDSALSQSSIATNTHIRLGWKMKGMRFAALVPLASREIELRGFNEGVERFETTLAKAWDSVTSVSIVRGVEKQSRKLGF